MGIELTHFDTKTGQPLNIDEKIDNCIAEYLFPEAKFQIGHMDPETVKENDLAPRPDRSLQFSSGKRLYYSNEIVGEQLFPKPSDRAAYGSLPFTPVNKRLDIKQARVLVIDDETGNSGGVLHDKEFAKNLVGDCYGKMSFELAQELTGKDNTPIQFRLGIRPQEGNDAFRIAKGTLAPDIRLDDLGSTRNDRGIKVEADANVVKDLNLGEYDLILASSMFKGRKGEQSIDPGSYKLDLGLGLKTEAEYGKQKLGVQVLVNYPKGVEQDILPIVKKKARELRDSLDSPAALANAFIKYYEDKQELQATATEEEKEFLPLFDAFEEEPARLSSEEALYKLLKTDLENHGQLLEHPYVVDQLKGFVQSRWKELGFSGGVRIKSALAQPSNKLGEDEICAPNLPDGKEVIVTRSPLVNSNGVIILKNKHIPELMRLNGSIHINPTTAAKHLQADFDGDRLAYERADKYPALAAEIKEKLLPQNRYPDIVKRDKVPYKGSFEKIAIQCADNQIGLIANQIMKSVAIYNDTYARPHEEKPEMVKKAAYYYRGVLAKAEKKGTNIPKTYSSQMKRVAQLADVKQLHSGHIDGALATIRSIQLGAVADLGNELQVAVDGPKSASRPNMDKFAVIKAASNCVKVGFMPDRKDQDVFLDRPAMVTTYSPIDTMLRAVNTEFMESTLSITPRLTHTFRDLFPKPDDQYLDIAKEIQGEFNDRLKHAMEMSNIYNNNPELAQTHLRLPWKDQQIPITRSDLRDPSIAIDQELTVSISPRPGDLDIPNREVAYAHIDGEKKLLGAVAINDITTPGETIKPFKTEPLIVPGITESQVEAAWRSLDSYTRAIQDKYDSAEKKQIAQGMWHVSHSRSEFATKKALAAFRVFPEESLAQLKELQLNQLQVVGLQYDTNKLKGQDLQGQTLECEMVMQEIPSKNGTKLMRGVAVEGQFLGPLQQESPGYPIDTIFKAEFVPDPPAKAIATLKDGTELKIGKVRDNQYKDTVFTGKEANLKITPFKDGRHRQQFRVSLDGKPIGELDKQSATQFRKLIGQKGVQGVKESFTVYANLDTPPSNTGSLKVEPDSLRYPWQLDQNKVKTDPEYTKELEMDNLRNFFKARYNEYTEKLKNHYHGDLQGKELDTAVARLAFLDNNSRNDVSAILSQSPTVTAKRPDYDSPDFPAFREKATAYIQGITNFVQQQFEKKKGIQR
ncbi:hypothetical protein cce_4975 [Crocosphaera subtropica ATCC 51142]|uniref:Uncharacterized protein n=1 Tax=Crocosphaera subtropica (strain ATCC 51142 / BH68) TaxID=43989 RepID=B1X2G0_CROS5|nr:hypothetical protein [Crocosphaera subtropica]ACB54321.1 hypothetical protein cce_4975 [Crocosphaera subtropica ATCC 51142]